MEKLLTNLQYDVDYDYKRSACTCNAYAFGDYCRCTKIVNAYVESINVNRVIDKLYKKHCNNPSKINSYCFDRICVAFKIYDKEKYEIKTCGGYYGEEIEGIYFDREEEIVNAYNKLLKLDSDIEKIKYCLKLEYGYLIERVVNTTSAYIEEVYTKAIVPPQTDYFIRLSKEVIEGYKNRNLPIAVCVKDGDKYVLVDGYHRFAANKEWNALEIIVIE